MYPLDWWSSETFFNIDDEVLRYRFLEMMFLIYNEGGFWRDNKPHFEKRFRRQMSERDWQELADLYIVEMLADGEVYWYHDAISKRLDISPPQIVANRSNGNRNKDPNGSQLPTQTEANLRPNGYPNGSQNGPNSAPFKVKEKKVKETEPKPPKGVEGSVGSPNGNGSHRASTPPLWAASLGADWVANAKIVGDYAKKLEDKIAARSIEFEKREEAFRFFVLRPIDAEISARIKSFFARSSEVMTDNALGYLAKWIRESEKAFATGTRNELVESDFFERLKHVIR